MKTMSETEITNNVARIFAICRMSGFSEVQKKQMADLYYKTVKENEQK